MLSTTFATMRAQNLQKLENLLNKNADLAHEIKDICSSLQPMEFESYYDYYTINTFKRGRSESGHVDLIDLKRREQARYYQRLKTNKNTTTSTDSPSSNKTDNNNLVNQENIDKIGKNVLNNKGNNLLTDIPSSSSNTTKVDLESSPPSSSTSSAGYIKNDSISLRDESSNPMGNNIAITTTIESSLNGINNTATSANKASPLDDEFANMDDDINMNDNDNENDLEETYQDQSAGSVSSSTKNGIEENNISSNNNSQNRNLLAVPDSTPDNNFISKLIGQRGPSEEINGNITKDSIIETTLMNEMKYSEHYRRRSARISKKVEAKKLSDRSSTLNKLTNQFVFDTDESNASQSSSNSDDNVNHKATRRHTRNDDNFTNNNTLSNDNETHILDLYESLVAKSVNPIRRSDWILPPRLRYTADKQLRTRATFTAIKIHELIGTSQMTKILSKFEGGVQGIRTSSRPSTQ